MRPCSEVACPWWGGGERRNLSKVTNTRFNACTAAGKELSPIGGGGEPFSPVTVGRRAISAVKTVRAFTSHKRVYNDNLTTDRRRRKRRRVTY